MKTKVKKPRLVECPRCTGTGEEPGAPEKPGQTALCWDCEGKKTVPRVDAIRSLAKSIYEADGAIEVDDNAKLSEVPDGPNGAYVAAWVWVGFTGHPGLDQEA